MRCISSILMIVFFHSLTISQVSNLFQEHALLTRDCKQIKGHAGRVIAEASEPELNTDVALAHAEEISKSLTLMENHLNKAKKLLTSDQTKKVDTHHNALAKSCLRLSNIYKQLLEELMKEKPNRSTVKKLATDLRNEISFASDHHESLKRKIGMK